jgi:hypothetical protein
VTLIRKQILISKRQADSLKRLARQRQISEAELIRETLDRELPHALSETVQDSTAWERAHGLMLALRAQGPIPNRPRRWTREELYEDRLSRHGRHSA